MGSRHCWCSTRLSMVAGTLVPQIFESFWKVSLLRCNLPAAGEVIGPLFPPSSWRTTEWLLWEHKSLAICPHGETTLWLLCTSQGYTLPEMTTFLGSSPSLSGLIVFFSIFLKDYSL
jgi:hypothetical protein